MNNTIDKQWVSRKVQSLIALSQELISFLETKQGEDGTIRITLKDLAAELKTSVPSATERLERLIDFGLVRRIDSRSYQMVHTNLAQTPLTKIEELMQVVSDVPSSSYKQQAEALGISVEELEIVYGYFVLLLK